MPLCIIKLSNFILYNDMNAKKYITDIGSTGNLEEL